MSLIFTYNEFPIELSHLNNGAYDYEYFDYMKNIKTSAELSDVLKELTKQGTELKCDINIKNKEIEIAIDNNYFFYYKIKTNFINFYYS